MLILLESRYCVLMTLYFYYVVYDIVDTARILLCFIVGFLLLLLLLLLCFLLLVFDVILCLPRSRLTWA